jgi:hypothetical protein
VTAGAPDMSDLDEYVPTALIAGSLDRARSLLYMPRTARAALISSDLLRAVARDPRMATIAQRASDIAENAQLGGNSLEALRAELRELVREGVLVSKRELTGKHHAPARGQGARIEVLAVPTRARPQAVERCVHSFAQAFRAEGRAPPAVAVVDSSPDVGSARQTRERLQRVASEQRIRVAVAGPPEKAAFARALSEVTGVGHALVSFALGDRPASMTARDVGANRNALLLGLAGEALLMADDDTLAAFRCLPEVSGELTLSGAHDPTEIVLFPDREAIVRATRQAPGVFAAIERMLGSPLAAVTSAHELGSIRLAPPGAPLVHRLLSGRAAVPVVSAGLWGDSGARFPAFHLWSRAALTDQLVRSAEGYPRLARSRELVRQAATPTLCAGAFLMSTCVALDNRGLLPPFAPEGRGQDLVFGLTLGLVDDGALIGHVPYGVSHSPVDGRPAQVDSLWDPSGWLDLSQVLHAALVHAAAGTDSAAAGARRLALLGRHLEEMVGRPWPELEGLLRLELCQTLRHQLERWQHALERHAGVHEAWARDLVAYRDQQVAALLEGRPLTDCLAGTPAAAGEARAALQSFIGDLGRLFQAWPALVAGARELRAQGRGLFPAG